MNFNKVILAGHLTRDIEIKYTQSGTAIGKSAIATTRKFKAQTGEMKEEVLFVDIVFFGRQAENANQYLRKGSPLLVEGRLKLEQWTAQDGSKRSAHNVQVENFQMGSNPSNRREDDRQQTPSRPNEQYNSPAHTNPQPNIPEIDIEEDQIPF